MIATQTQIERKILEVLTEARGFKVKPAVLWHSVFAELEGANRPTFDAALVSLIEKKQIEAIPNDDTGHKYRITDAGEARLLS